MTSGLRFCNMKWGIISVSTTSAHHRPWFVPRLMMLW
jgi:hypothetical protein